MNGSSFVISRVIGKGGLALKQARLVTGANVEISKPDSESENGVRSRFYLVQISVSPHNFDKYRRLWTQARATEEIRFSFMFTLTM